MSRADQSFSKLKPAIWECGLGDADGLSERVAAADPYPELHLIVQATRAPEAGRCVCGLDLAVRPANGGSRCPHRGAAAVVADRDVLVVRQQRIVGPELTADVGCVVNADVEIRVIADLRRQMQRALRYVVQMRLDFRPMRSVAEER